MLFYFANRQKNGQHPEDMSEDLMEDMGITRDLNQYDASRLAAKAYQKLHYASSRTAAPEMVMVARKIA